MAARGERAEAEEHLRRARQAQPNDPATLHNIGERLRQAGRCDEALASYREALSIDPDFAPAHVGIGAALLHLERHEEALISLERGSSLDAGAPTAAHYLASQTLLGLGRDDEAAAHFERAIERDPNHAEALNDLALWQFGRQEYQQSMALYRAHGNLLSDDPIVHANTGVTLYFLGCSEEALVRLERALQFDPNHETARRLATELREGASRVPR